MVLNTTATIFHLYHGCQFYWWGNPEYTEKTTDLSQVTDKLHQYIYVCESSIRHLGIMVRDYCFNPMDQTEPEKMFAQRDNMNTTVTMYLIKKKERARMVLTVPEELVRLLINKANLRTQSFTGLRFNAVYNEQRHGKYCKTTTHHFHFLCLRDEGHINLLLSVRSSVRLSVRI